MASILVNGMDIGYLKIHLYITADSSVGRAGDCRSDEKSDISRSLVQIRLGGLLLRKSKKCTIVIGRSRRAQNRSANIVKPISLLCRWLAIHYLRVTM